MAVILVALTAKYTKDRLKQVNWVRKQKEPKEPNLFIQAIKDKHNKFCTRVEVA